MNSRAQLLKPAKNHYYEGGVSYLGGIRPFYDVEEFFGIWPENTRYEMMFVPVRAIGDTTITLYWFVAGIADENLALFNAGSSSATKTPVSSARYTPVAGQTTISMPELIGADLSYFVFHKDVSAQLQGSASPATAYSVQVDVSTGLVTSLYPWDDGVIVWADYLPATVVTPTDPSIQNSYPYSIPQPITS